MAKVPVTFSLDEDVVAALQAEVRSGRAESASAVVLDLLRERLQRNHLRELLDEMDAEYGPLTEEGKAWARVQFEEAERRWSSTQEG